MLKSLILTAAVAGSLLASTSLNADAKMRHNGVGAQNFQAAQGFLTSGQNFQSGSGISLAECRYNKTLFDQGAGDSGRGSPDFYRIQLRKCPARF